MLGSNVGFLRLSPEFALSALVSRVSYTIQNYNTNEIVLYWVKSENYKLFEIILHENEL